MRLTQMHSNICKHQIMVLSASSLTMGLGHLMRRIRQMALLRPQQLEMLLRHMMCSECVENKGPKWLMDSVM